MTTECLASPCSRLPPQLPRQRAGRMAEQFLERSGSELVDPLEFLGMNAPGDEEAVDAEAMRAGKVGAHGVADGEDTIELDLVAAMLGGERDGALVDRPVRLAVEDHLATELAVELGDGAGAIDQPVAALDDDIGVGADQRQFPRQRFL